jgi:lipoprotein-anchoring transpeptidase ErfK/SrfK
VRVSVGAREFGLAGKIAALVGAALLLPASGTVVGLASSRTVASGVTPGSSTAAAGRSAKTAPRLTITPRDRSGNVRPDLGVVVKAAHGVLGDVVVRLKGDKTPAPGVLSSDRTSWRTRWTLMPGRSYTVRATAGSPDGTTVTASSTFSTLQAAQTISVSDVTPGPAESVGVGMPIIVTFDQPALNRDRVERALEVRSDKPARGAWRWISDQQVIFRTKSYWQPYQQVTFTAHLAGVRAARDVYGSGDYTLRFRVGDANISKVNVQTHRMVVSRNGKRVRDIGISAGRGGDWKFTTTNGVHAVMGKGNPVVMTSEWMGITDPADPEYYKLTVADAVQISSSGEYVHSAPWSLWAQGNTNVSHGCVNASPEFAAWFYGISQRGDIVTVTGTNRELEWNNGYGYWQKSWKQWLLGSALKQPVTVTAVKAPHRASPTGHQPAR